MTIKMKKPITVLSIALLVVSLGASLALAAPPSKYEDTTAPTWEYISSSHNPSADPTDKDTTGPMREYN